MKQSHQTEASNGSSSISSRFDASNAVTIPIASNAASRFSSCALILASDHQTETLAGMIAARLSPRISAICQFFMQTRDSNRSSRTRGMFFASVGRSSNVSQASSPMPRVTNPSAISIACVIAFIAFTIGLSYGALPAQTTTIKGQVVGVHDGDSITLLTADKVQVKVRLEGIDAPELKQPFSTQSKQVLSTMVFAKNVMLHSTGKDRYGRTLATVIVDGVNVNLAMVRLGMAWHFEKYSKDTALRAAQIDARAARRGLWIDPAPVPPWEWRSLKK